MLYPQKLKADEYIRLFAIRNRADDAGSNVVRYVKSFDEYLAFVQKYRWEFDLYNQISTNRGTMDGTEENQYRRRVLFLDFDRKDHDSLKTAQDCSEWIHDKLPKLFIHCVVDSGHGFHCYVSVPQTEDVFTLTALNKTIAQITEADVNAVKPTQMSRIPWSFNHKSAEVTGNCQKEEWPLVKVVINSYGDKRFKPLEIKYLRRMCDEFYREEETERILDKVTWHYEELETASQYLCIRRAMEEGVDQGQRNFWHGRIVAMLQKQGYTREAILRECQGYNLKCRPPKKAEEIEKDTERFLRKSYKLLGCYEAFAESDPHRACVYVMCDKCHCGTYHAGATITIEDAKLAEINRKALGNRNLRKLKGIHFLVLTVMSVYVDTYGRRGFRVKDLEKLLHSSVARKQCVDRPRLKVILRELLEKKYIEIISDDRKPTEFMLCKLKIARRLKEFQQGYI